LVNVPEDASEMDAAPPQPSSLQWQPESPSPERTATHSVSTPKPFLYAKGVAMRKESRSREAIEMLKLAGKSPSYRLKAHVQVIDIQYLLARTLESVGQIAEAATLLRRIAQTNPRFKDAAY
jgi:hypothetical protein